MSFTSYSAYEKYSSDDQHTITHSTVVVHELTDGELASMMGLGGSGSSSNNDDAAALKVPQTQYEIESGTSDMGETSDDDDENSDEFILDHWFPSLLHKSMIEFLDDDDDEFMLDHPLDILTSTESAEIEEEEDSDDNDYFSATKYDEEEEEEEEGLHHHQATVSHARKLRKRSKHKHHQHHDDDNEDISVPVEVIHIVL